MAVRNAYVEFLLELLAPLGQIHSRPMMGGHTLYCDGVVFAIVANGALFLKADAVNRPAFESRSLKAFQPFPDTNATMSYYETPPEVFEDPDAMQQWCGGAVEAGRRAQDKKRTRKVRTK